MPKLLNINTDKTFSRIGDRRITSALQAELYTLYKSNPSQVKKILDCIDVGWRQIQDKIDIEGLVLLYNISNYTVSSYRHYLDGARYRLDIYYTYKDSTLMFTAKI